MAARIPLLLRLPAVGQDMAAENLDQFQEECRIRRHTMEGLRLQSFHHILGLRQPRSLASHRSAAALLVAEPLLLVLEEVSFLKVGLVRFWKSTNHLFPPVLMSRKFCIPLLLL